MEQIKKEATTIHLLPEDKQKAKSRAKKMGRSFSVYISDLIRVDTENDK
ncbi:TPA: hypothetical protein QCY05_001771 [Bacillus wiedmannii]|nr:hypothetical protein [Bacillus wiedmannii]